MAKGDLGKMIYRERKKKYNKASEFAKKLGISSAHLSDIEKGNRLPSKELMKKIIGELKNKDNNEEIFYDSLAKESNEDKNIPIDIREYMIENPEVKNVIRIVKKKNIDKTFWNDLENKLNIN